MIARIARLLLALQVVCAAALAALIYRYFLTQQVVWSVSLGIAAVVLVRIWITANTFVLARRYRSMTPIAEQIGWRASARLLFAEFVSTMQTSSWTMPFCSFEKRHIANSSSLPVLLVHGYVCNSGYWHAMSKVLTAAGISHHAVTLEPVFASIEQYLPTILRAVKQLQADSKSDRIILVGHSMGGLVCRAYLREHGSLGIARLITIGTPHCGTALANHGVGDNIKQMAVTRHGTDFASSEWLTKLEQSETTEIRAVITSIYSHHDNIVAPQASGYLAGATNIAFSGIGHVELALHKKVQQLVVAQLLATT